MAHFGKKTKNHPTPSRGAVICSAIARRSRRAGAAPSEQMAYFAMMPLRAIHFLAQTIAVANSTIKKRLLRASAAGST